MVGVVGKLVILSDGSVNATSLFCIGFKTRQWSGRSQSEAQSPTLFVGALRLGRTSGSSAAVRRPPPLFEVGAADTAG